MSESQSTVELPTISKTVMIETQHGSFRGVNRVNVAMEGQNQSANSTPDLSPPENHDDSRTHRDPRLGTVIPNRIFVGGIDDEVSESDLQHVFAQHGAVKEVKIVIDRSGTSKGYGFVTFETQDDALKILRDANGISFKDKKLNIGRAVRRQHASAQTKSAPVSSPDCVTPLPVSCGTLYLTTSTGYPYAYHNGVAYFCCPNMSPPAHPPVMLPQYHQPVHQHYQWGPNQYQWNVVQPLMPPSPVVYSQQPDYRYQSADGGPVQPNLPVMEDTTPELIMESTVQPVYPLYPQGTEGMRLVVLQHDPKRDQMFPHSRVHLRPEHHRCVRPQGLSLPAGRAAQPADASMRRVSQPLM